MKLERLKRVTRFVRPSAWRFMALVASDPGLDRSFARLHLNDDFEALLAQPEPWFCFPAIEFLEERIEPGMHVLEWGSGASTLWFEGKGCTVTSVEDDERWYDLVRTRIAPETTLIFCVDRAKYCAPVESLRGYDVVVIDGSHRNDCAAFVFEHIEAGAVKDGCMVVFDDSHNPAHRADILRLAELCRVHACFSGASGVPIDKQTSIFLF